MSTPQEPHPASVAAFENLTKRFERCIEGVHQDLRLAQGPAAEPHIKIGVLHAIRALARRLGKDGLLELAADVEREEARHRAELAALKKATKAEKDAPAP